MVPYAVGVKNAGTPAPPALILSARVPLGVERRGNFSGKFRFWIWIVFYLGGQLNLQLPLKILPLKLLVFPDVRGDHPLHLLGPQQQAKTPLVNPKESGNTISFSLSLSLPSFSSSFFFLHPLNPWDKSFSLPGIIADHSEVLHPSLAECQDEILRNATNAKSPDKQL